MGKQFHPKLNFACDYVAMLGIKLLENSEKVPNPFYTMETDNYWCK